MLFADEDEMEREIRLNTLCVEGEDEIAPEVKSNREALKTAEKLLEYARSKGNERLSLILSKRGVTTLTNAVSGQRQKAPGIWRFLRESGHLEIFPGNMR